jgi:hydroxyacylglutathione hydrolase
MILEKVKNQPLAHISYFLGSSTNAVIIDPQRNCTSYINIADRERMKIKRILETHQNEDYVAGSKELSELTGAKIYHGPFSNIKYGMEVDDGQEFNLEGLTIKAITTPGHTPDGVSYAIIDNEAGDKPVLIFTGDTLFVNEVGRTDLGGEENARKYSEDMYDSIHKKILPLGDQVVLYPAHGAGSICGVNIADREISALGTERLFNPMLLMTRREFIEYKVNEHPYYPSYFKTMEKLNSEGAPSIGWNLGPKYLNLGEFKAYIDEDAVVLDARPPPGFGAGHIKGSYNIPKTLLKFSGSVLPYDTSIVVLLGNQCDSDYFSHGLMSMGYDNVEGYLRDSIVSWYTNAYPVETLTLMTVQDLRSRLVSDDWHVLDVRSENEYDEGHIEGSLNLYVGNLPENLDKIPRNGSLAVICSSGMRSSLACSILQRNDFHNISNVLGGMMGWFKANYPTV